MMARADLNYWRLFLFVPSMTTVCMAWGQHQERENASTDGYNPFNRSVILNRASEHYLALIFNEYSDNFTRRISTTRFEDLLHDLNLGDDFRILHQKLHSDSQEHKQHERVHTRSNNVLSTAGMQRRSKRRSMGKFDEFSQGIELEDAVVNPRVKCLEEHKLMQVHKVNEKVGLSQEDFVRICPSLIHQLRVGVCSKDEERASDPLQSTEDSKLLVWGYGLLSITAISLASLFAIAVIPFMGRSCYKKLMSFLVALAVGTLAGDALLHLIPHAFHDSEENDEGEHKINVFKSCVIMAGIYVFFSVECILKARLSRKNGARKKAHDCDDVTEPEKMTPTEKKKYAADFEKTIGSKTIEDQCQASRDATYFPEVRVSFPESYNPMLPCELEVESCKEEHLRNSLESPREKGSLWGWAQHCKQRGSVSDRSKHSFSDIELVSPGPSETTTATLTSDKRGNFEVEHLGDCHGDPQHHADHHHHHHSHNIDKSTSIATVAWMVIVGDGFHNFSDGLAIGAAFSVSLTSGLTTAIAVFCHELPHELGDFAILLKSGLTFRQAVTYNVASAIISYIGLVLGVIIGDIHSAHSWVLALTAGMFLYVSLVDMLPELSNYIQEGGDWSLVLSQNLGILTGTFIMLVIALYEHYAN
ncbi:metal cation symporter ZIP14-like [Acropora palmata]|uniref:metal cation symporter ZIP14-like n=1 Tax=Acropora palmata TaxID=6131 RepID=UPI003DA076D0